MNFIIIYYAYIIDLMCKLFADDTTLGDADKDLNTLVNRRKIKSSFIRMVQI